MNTEREAKGNHATFRVIRTDQEHEEGAQYFVLDYGTDPYATELLGEYAETTAERRHGENLVQGNCPMGCGRTLMLTPAGLDNVSKIVCGNPDCPRPTAVRDLLDDPEHEHIVRKRHQDYTIQHPLRERLEGGLFACRLNIDLRGEVPPPEGLIEHYRVTERADGRLKWEKLP